jgi:hypothetical protein
MGGQAPRRAKAAHSHKIFGLHSSGDKSMFKHLVPVVAVALIAGTAFAQPAAPPAAAPSQVAAPPAAMPAAAPAEKTPAKSSTHHKKKHHHHTTTKAPATTGADTAPAK